MENFGYLEFAIAQEGLELAQGHRDVAHPRRPGSRRISSDPSQPTVWTRSAQTPAQQNSQDLVKDNPLPVDADQAFTWWGMV